jgi:hypothetical protein
MSITMPDPTARLLDLPAPQIEPPPAKPTGENVITDPGTKS